MVIKVYISSVTCNNQQRKNQHTILSKLQSEKINFVKIDITDPKHSAEKLHMQEHSKSRKEGTFPLPPQVFNELEYCGDYDTFADALETQNLWEFLKLKELQDQMKQKIEHDDSLVDFKKEGEEEEEKKDEEGGEKTNKEEEMVEAVKGEEKEEVKEEEGEKKEEKEEDTKETEAKEKSDEVEEKESKPEEAEAQE